jgi:general secretion pathway protein M
MISAHSIGDYVTRHPNLAGLVYLASILICGLITLSMVTDLVDRYNARNASLDTLSRLQGRELPSSKDGVPSGSPFLDGQTLTTASATLLQRLTSIVASAGGTVISSEIAQRGTQSKDGYVTAIANCELEQEALPKILYEIEAGMPFLFIDQIQIQAPVETGQAGRMRVFLTVAGLWTGAQ